MHDNAPPHRSLQTQAFFEQSVIRLLKQPAYSPDYNLQDRFTFRNFEVFRRDNEFQEVEDIRQCLNCFFDTLDFDKMINQCEKLLQHIKKVIKSEGDYVI